MGALGTEKQWETGWFGANLLYFVYVAAVSRREDASCQTLTQISLGP